MLKKTHRIQLKIELLSGMHITGGDDTFDIGGADSQVIKNPLTGEPYIPGSTLKGKIRSLLEFKYGTFINNELKPVPEHNQLLSLFVPNTNDIPQMTRAIFRDAVLTESSKIELQTYLGEHTYTEIKAENKINRFKGTADAPRFIERVPAGSKFIGYIDLLEFDNDDYQTLYKYLETGVNLLNYNYIGGSGSRGYGRIQIEMEELNNNEGI